MGWYSCFMQILPLLILPFLQDPGAIAAEPSALASRTLELRHLGLTVHEERVVDPASGRVLVRGRLADGTAVDVQALLIKEQRAAVDARAGVSKDLAAHLAEVDATALVDVAFWLREPAGVAPRDRIEQQLAAGVGIEAARRVAYQEASARFAPLNQAFAEQLAASGIEVLEVAEGWPNVFARMRADQVAAWAADPAVDQAYRSYPTWMPELDNAQGTMRTPIVWDRGISAVGSPVKTMVNDPDHVTTSNPYLPPVILLNNGSTGSHASSCAGNIAMDHPTLMGAAVGLPQLYSGDGSGDTQAPVVWGLAINAGISFGNCSWWNGHKGSIAYLDRFFDYTLREYAMMMFKSTGNQGSTSTPYTTTPGNAYNTTNSGSYNDGNNTDWAGDAMASYSSYWDPAEGHEKPELASPGDGVATTSTTGTTSSFNGTSSASPLTCGVATLMATRDNTLMARPEAVKAVLMASAWHNIEGNEVLSEKDGAGGVHALAADSVLRDGQYQYGTLTAGSFSGGVYDVTIPAIAGDETRVCALWFSKANSAYSTDMLDMDLDATLLAPNGAVLATSADLYNPFEILSFLPPTTGNYKLRLSNQRFNGVSERYCVAWSSRLDAAESEVQVSGSFTPGGMVTIEFKSRYRAGDAYQAHVAGATLPNAVNLGGGWILPLKPAGVYAQSGGWAGFSGFLNAAGEASTTRMVPNSSALVGRTFYVAMYTSSGPDIMPSEAFAVPIQ